MPETYSMIACTICPVDLFLLPTYKVEFSDQIGYNCRIAARNLTLSTLLGRKYTDTSDCAFADCIETYRACTDILDFTASVFSSELEIN